jgi:tetratricopeptide (TPR) repeat protein
MHKRDRKLHQQKLRRDRIRREKHIQQSKLADVGGLALPGFGDDPEPEDDGRPLPPLVHSYAAEHALNQIHHLIDGRKFESIEEANAFLSTLTGQGLQRAIEKKPPTDLAWRAQEVAYRAMEAHSPLEATALARQALELDPDCVDAMCTLAHATSRSRAECLARLQQAVETGERMLGKDFIANNRGHFWGITETRPYMRARFDLAMELIGEGETEEGIAHWEALLDLNPNDNQGVRDLLLPVYLMYDNLAGARRLFERYPEEDSAIFNWGRTLERFLSGDVRAAARYLKQARAQNQHVEKYFTGSRPQPKHLPDTYGWGDESEAVHCAFFLTVVWQMHSVAVNWLKLN